MRDVLFLRELAAHISYWIPYGKPTNKNDSDEDYDNIFWVNADRISVDNEVPA